MWAILKPLTKSPRLEREILTTIVPDQKSFFSRKDVSVVMSEIERITDSIVKDHRITTRDPLVDVDVETFAKEWFNYLVHYIMKNAASRLTCTRDNAKPGISAADLLWAIKNLPREKLSSCIGYCYHIGVAVLNYGIVYQYEAYDRAFEEEFDLDDYCEKCWESHTSEKNLTDFTISCRGRLLLYRWICATLSSCLREAEEDRSSILPNEVMQAFYEMGEEMFRITAIPSHVLEPNDASNCQLMNLKKAAQSEGRYYKRQKSLSYVPHDIIESDILPRLSFDSIVRLRYICKEWKNSICSVSFDRLLQERHRNSVYPSFGIINSHEFDINSPEVYECSGVDLVAVDTISTIDMWPVFYSSCSGFLCFALGSESTTVFTIGNPVTGEWKLLPPLDFVYSDMDLGPGLAVDLSSNPPWYKLVIFADGGDYDYILRVFSSDTHEWKPSVAKDSFLSSPFDSGILIRGGNSVYVDGKLYWELFDPGELLCSYDLEKETIEEIDLPFGNICGYFAIGSLKQPNGKQRLTCCKCKHSNAMEAYVYIEDGRWEKLWSICLSSVFQPLPYTGGDTLLLANDGKLFAYNITTGERRMVMKNLHSTIIQKRIVDYRMTLSRLP